MRKKTYEQQWRKILELKGSSESIVQRRIHLCRQLLKSTYRSNMPLLWAKVTYRLATDLGKLSTSEQPTSQETQLGLWKSLVHSPLTYKEFPRQWWFIRYSLGFLYNYRVQGERDQNLRQALKYLHPMSKLIQRRVFPFNWASGHLLLATTYEHRIRGKPSEHARQALHHLRQAEKVFIRRKYPDKWVIIQEEYGRVYPFYPGLSPVRQYSLAIKYEQRALEGFKRQSNRGGVAEIENNLGCSYRELFYARREPGDLQQAHRHFQRAVQLYRGIKSREADRHDAQKMLARVLHLLHSREFKRWNRISPRLRKLAVRINQGRYE